MSRLQIAGNRVSRQDLTRFASGPQTSQANTPFCSSAREKMVMCTRLGVRDE